MKISVTKRELQSILSSHFRVNVTEVDMLDNTPELLDLLNSNVGKLIPIAAEKINAIKALRSLSSNNTNLFGYCLGLADAKFAVENWRQLITFINANGRFPKEGFSGTGCYV